MKNHTASYLTSELPEYLAGAVDPSYYGTHLFQLIAHTIVFIFGVPGNCLILRVYWTKTGKTGTHVLIMALAWADLSVCLLRVPDVIVRALLLAGTKIPAPVNTIWALGAMGIVSSYVITTVIAVDRYDCVCHPRRRFFTYRRSKAAACAALLFSAIAIIPDLISAITYYRYYFVGTFMIVLRAIAFITAVVVIILCYGRVYVVIRRHVKTGVVPRPNKREDSNPRRDNSRTGLPPHAPPIADSHVNVVGKTVSTFNNQVSFSNAKQAASNINRIHTSACNASTSNSVAIVTDAFQEVQGRPQPEPLEPAPGAVSGDRYPRPEPGNCTRHTPKRIVGAALQRKTTRMLFITTVVFILTWMVYWIYAIVKIASYSVNESVHPAVKELTDGVYTALYINNVVNPLIYGMANRRFRKDCWEVLRHR